MSKKIIRNGRIKHDLRYWETELHENDCIIDNASDDDKYNNDDDNLDLEQYIGDGDYNHVMTEP
jgi:hypothetical protein